MTLVNPKTSYSENILAHLHSSSDLIHQYHVYLGLF